jgi:hypothetical protein
MVIVGLLDVSRTADNSQASLLALCMVATEAKALIVFSVQCSVFSFQLAGFERSIEN